MATKIGLQFGQMELDDLPNDLMVDRCVTVDQDVPKPDRPLKVGNSCRQDGIEPSNSGQRLAYDFKLTFDCTAQHVVREVVFVGPARSKPPAPLYRSQCVPKQCGSAFRAQDDA